MDQILAQFVKYDKETRSFSHSGETIDRLESNKLLSIKITLTNNFSSSVYSQSVMLINPIDDGQGEVGDDPNEEPAEQEVVTVPQIVPQVDKN